MHAILEGHYSLLWHTINMRSLGHVLSRQLRHTGGLVSVCAPGAVSPTGPTFCIGNLQTLLARKQLADTFNDLRSSTFATSLIMECLFISEC